MRQRNPRRTYWDLLRTLHIKEFTWFVPNDDNRVVDGLDLRYEFLADMQESPSVWENWLLQPCSMLEMLIALSRRLAFNGGGESMGRFWEMMDNIGLRGFNDASHGSPQEVDHILQRVIDRTYDQNGNGGLFPLRETNLDQRQVELWYQMNSYLIERG